MECKDLRVILALIQTYRPQFASLTAIAEELDISDRTLRGYLDQSAFQNPMIPQRQERAFLEFVVKVIGGISLDSARRLLTGSAIVFHNALAPSGGTFWSEMISSRLSPERLAVLKAPISLGFGQSDDDDDPEPDAIVELGEGFALCAAPGLVGEGFLLAEHGGVWHLITLSQKQRVVPVKSRQWELPGQRDNGERAYLREKTHTGSYRYFAVAVKGHLSSSLHKEVTGVNPVSQASLDAISTELLALDQRFVSIAGVSLQVVSPP